jgi:hypothetical protein
MAGLWLWGAHAPSRAGDDVLVVATFSPGNAPDKACFGEAPKPAREGRALPRPLLTP